MINNKNCFENNSYTDLAIEEHAALRGDVNQEISGVEEEIYEHPMVKVTKINIITPEGAQKMGRPMGSYITIETQKLNNDRDSVCHLSNILSQYLSPLLPAFESNNNLILVAGLGNWRAAPDSLGTQVAEDTMATYHIFKCDPQSVAGFLRPVAVVTPGVFGFTGIESATILQGIVKEINPACLIVIDALAANNLNRVNATIQISTTGINPGSGLANHRNAINQKTIGVPVISIGVPTVVHARTIIKETLSTLVEQNSASLVKSFDAEAISQNLLAPFGGNLVVTPKDIDEQIGYTARVIAAGLAQAMHPGVNQNNFYLYLQ